MHAVCIQLRGADLVIPLHHKDLTKTSNYIHIKYKRKKKKKCDFISNDFTLRTTKAFRILDQTTRVGNNCKAVLIFSLFIKMMFIINTL